MISSPVRVGVIGAGNMGSNHIRVYQELPQANLVGVVEPDECRAIEIEDEHSIPVYEKPGELVDVDAVSVAAPNDDHLLIAEKCIENGTDLLIEKPLATTVEDAQAIADLCRHEDIVLQVGHVERFNPVVRTLKAIIDEQEIIAIEARRLGPYDNHLNEVNVVFDLMIHDLDIIMEIVSDPVECIAAIGNSHFSDNYDYVDAQMSFSNGILASLTASHVTNRKIRQLAVTTEDAYIPLDYQKQEISVQRVGRELTTSLGRSQGGYRTESVIETPFVPTREPLKEELEHFLDCVINRSEPAVPVSDGIRAVELAEKILKQTDA